MKVEEWRKEEEKDDEGEEVEDKQQKKTIGEAGPGVSEDVSGDSIETASTQAHTHTHATVSFGILAYLALACEQRAVCESPL